MMKKSTAAFFVVTGLLVGGMAIADSHLGDTHEDHEAHEQATGKGGMQQRHHGQRGHGEQMPPMFGMMDENNDGKLTREEVQRGTDKMFVEADTNKDGVITKDEMQAQHKKMHEKMHDKMHDKMQSKMQDRWKAADKNGDGALSRAEVEASDMKMMAQHFDKLDKNKDGKLTSEEMRGGMMSSRSPAPSQTK